MEWLKPVLSICWSFTFILIFCEFGATVIEQFELLNDELNKSNWYLFSTDVQRMFSFLMANTQKSSCIRGFGNISCTRAALKKVTFWNFFTFISQTTTECNICFQTLKVGFSYFMALRRIGN